MPIFVYLVTNGNKLNDRIIKLVIAKLEGNNVNVIYSKLFNPKSTLKSYIPNLNGINKKDLEGAMQFEKDANEIYEILNNQNLVLLGNRFFYGALKSEFKRINTLLKCKITLLPQSTINDLNHFNKVITNTDDYFENLKNQFVTNQQSLIKPYILSSHISSNQISELPKSSGVYIIYNSQNEVIYVGKSINIQERIKSHLRNDIYFDNELKLSAHLSSIEYIQTGSNLGAMIKELDLIEKLMPQYNKRLRGVTSHYISTQIYSNGYLCAENALTKFGLDTNLTNCIMINTSKKHLINRFSKLCDDHRLCKKLLGIEKTNGTCFGYQLDKCNGACCGKESADDYNQRFIEAFTKSQIQKWPYDCAISIRLKESIIDESFFVKDWKITESLMDLNHAIFNFERYKVLINFFKNTRSIDKYEIQLI